MARHTQRGRRVGLLHVLLVAVAFGPAGAAWGQDSIFDALGDVVRRLAAPARDDAPLVEVDVLEPEEVRVNAAAIARQFTPQLRSIMGVELQFARKVCELNAEQFAVLRQAGRAEVESLAAKLAEQMNNRGGHLAGNPPLVVELRGFIPPNNANAPRAMAGNGVAFVGGMGGDAAMGMGLVAPEVNGLDFRKLVQQALQQKIAEMVPAEVAARYRAELAGREQAQREAAREMMLLHIDRRLLLTAEQYDALAAAIDRNWNDAWTTNLEAYWHEALAPMPPMDVLRTHLTVQQEALWNERNSPHMGNVAGFGDMGMGMMRGFEMAVPGGNVQGQIMILERPEPVE